MSRSELIENRFVRIKINTWSSAKLSMMFTMSTISINIFSLPQGNHGSKINSRYMFYVTFVLLRH